MTQGLKQIPGTILVDPATFAPVGLLGGDGREYLLPVLTANGSGATTPRIDGTVIGSLSPSTVRGTTFGSLLGDSSGTPGSIANNNTHGRAAFAAAGASVTVTSSIVTANSDVFVSLGGADATLTSVRVTVSAGSFTVTGNAAATGITPFAFFVLGT